MFEHNYPRRSRKFRIAFYAIVVTSIISIAAAGFYSAAFSFAQQVDEVPGRAADKRVLPSNAQRVSAPEPEPTCAPPPSGMVTWWPADGNANDIQGPTLENGTLMNGAAFATGKVGQAFDLDGVDDFVAVEPSTVLDLGTGDFTVQAWIYPRTYGSDAAIISRWDMLYGLAWDLRIGWPSGGGDGDKLYFFFGDAANNGYRISNTVTLNQWHHVAAVRRGGVLYGYLDGVEYSAGVQSGSGNGPTARLRIGNRPGYENGHFNGMIDEAGIFNRGLSASEIQAIFNAGTSGMCKSVCTAAPAGMVGWWPGNGNTNDIVGGNNGSLVNGVAYAAGRVDQAFSFNQASQQYVSLPAAAAATLNNSAGSIAAWVNPSAVGEYDMVTAFGTGNPGEAVGFAINNGNVRIYHHTDPFDWQTAIPVSINTWTHLTYTWDGTTERLYKNGVLADSRARNFSFVGAGFARIGFGFINDPSVFFPGLIDEVAIFNRTLDAAEVASMAAASGGVCPRCASTPSNLISWWPGEGGTDIVGSNNGTLTNGASIAVGKVGSAFSFDGVNDYVVVPDAPSLDLTRISMTFWFKLNELNRIHELVNKFGPEGSNTIAYGSEVGTNNKVCFRISTDGTLNGLSDVCSTTVLTTGVWYHFAGTYDGTSMNIYINGRNEGSVSKSGNIFVSARDLTLGTYGYFPWFLSGSLDEVQLADRAFTPEEVNAIYNAGITGVCRGCAPQPANMISWWRGEDNVHDAVGGNYGVLLGGATFAPGKVGRAFSFNGTSAAVRIPDSPTLDVTTEFTIGAWVKPAAIPSYPNGALVISKVGPIGNLNGYQMAVSNIGGTNKIWCGFNTGGNNWPQFSVTGGNLAVGEWTYVACTYDHNTLAVHQNGVQVGSAAVGPVTVANTTSNIKLGSDDVGQQFYSGLIDEPMIFGRALNVGELLSLYDAGGLGICQAAPTVTGCGAIPPGMISWWRGEGNAMDRRKAHHGSLLNAPTITTGKVGRAFGFAGGNEAVDAGTWFNLQTFSIEMWVKPNNGQTLYSNIIDNNHSSGPLRSWVLENLNTQLTFQWYSADFPAGTNILFELVPDTWQHIVITRDANRVTRGYLNRSLVGTMSTSSDIPYDGTQRLWIGNWVGGNRAFNGTIDEVTLYNRSIAESEVASLYNADSYGKCAGSQTRTDMDGDMLSDLSIFRPSGANGAEWWWLKSTGGNGAVQFGVSTDTIVASDYTGDGKTDVAFWRPSTGQWYILRSEDFSFYAFPFGGTGDIPAPADYDGDGKTDASVFRPSTTTWYINKSTGGTGITVFGAAGDKPVPEDYDGDGKADIAVFRPNGTGGAEWWIAQSSGGVFATQFGQPTDKAVPADYTGDGKADIAFWMPSNGFWYVLRSDDFSYYAFPFGGTTDVPVPADYDGDARVDAGVFRSSNSNWYISRSTAGLLIQQFGSAGDVPVPNAFVR